MKMRRFFVKDLPWALFCVCWLVASCLTAAADTYDPDTPRFLMSTFRNADQTKLYIAESFDGRAYRPVGGAHVYQTTDGTLIRDPSMMRHKGFWYVCHTSGPLGGLGRADYFRVLRSPDLVNWTHLKDVSMAAVPNTRHTWAPEWFLDDDGSVHVVMSVSYWWTNEHVLYEIHPVDPDDLAGEWSEPVRLHGPAFPEFVPNLVTPQLVGVYDPYVLKKNGT